MKRKIYVKIGGNIIDNAQTPGYFLTKKFSDIRIIK
jgi:hypothetical protein